MKDLENFKSIYVKAFDLLNREEPQISQAKMLLLQGEVAVKDLMKKQLIKVIEEVLKDKIENND